MTTLDDESGLWLPLAQAAPRLGLAEAGLRTRVRRGLVMTKRDNRGRLLVSVPTTSPEPAHEPRREPVHEPVTSRLTAALERVATAEATLAEARVAHERERAELRDALIRERERADRLEAALAEARKPVLLRLAEALRRPR